MKTVAVRYRLNLEIYYKDLKVKVDEKYLESEESLRKYLDRYFQLNYRKVPVVAYYIAKIFKRK